eukprot:m.183311 g.183311  ORF g.183311 m.183311 type:complete len:65 (+) comp13592_c0_seq21:4079-4273(+)
MSETTIAIITGNSNTGWVGLVWCCTDIQHIQFHIIPILKEKYPQYHIRAVIRKKENANDQCSMV